MILDPIWEIHQRAGQPFTPAFLELLLSVRNINAQVFEAAEGSTNHTARECWDAAENTQTTLRGGGVMTVLRGHILEKSAVNLSVVSGPKYPALEGEYAGKPFAAAGVSLISHPKNPYAPIMHLNVRMIRIFSEGSNPAELGVEPIAQWMGGGADLTPMIPFEEDTTFFHDAMKTVCERSPQVASYEKFKAWADEYFYIPHRKEPRGVGGIFFDYVPVKEEKDLGLLLDVGHYAAKAYEEILTKRVTMSYTDDLKEQHLYWRGRYAEFNLVYDRGTRFGLLSGGNHKAIFCSLPPVVKW